jgi:hypothetical protein
LQKAAPKHWFASGQQINVAKCPTRFGLVSWTTKAVSNDEWEITVDAGEEFTADLAVHVHPPDGSKLKSTSLGTLEKNKIIISRETLRTNRNTRFRVE